jgi:ribosomal protein S3
MRNVSAAKRAASRRAVRKGVRAGMGEGVCGKAVGLLGRLNQTVLAIVRGSGGEGSVNLCA